MECKAMVEVSTMKLKHIGGMVNIFTLPFVHVDDKRAYIFSIFSVLVRILESISLSRLRALLNVMFGHHGVVKIPMFRASQI